jgi:hypothetical protein
MRNERSDYPPEWVFNSFDNIEDVIRHITDEGLDELNFDKDQVVITRLGIVLTLTNRHDKPFRVFVCPDILSDDDLMRRVLSSYSQGIENVDVISTLIN